MSDAPEHRTLIVANRTAGTPLLLEEVRRRAKQRPTAFALLIPDAPSKKHADWTLETAATLLGQAAGRPVEGIVGEGDAFESIRLVLAQGRFDDVVISTLPKKTSEWLRRDLPARVRRLGVPVTVITPSAKETERIGVTIAAGPGL